MDKSNAALSPSIYPESKTLGVGTQAPFTALDGSHRDILRICSLAWIPISRAQLLECLELAHSHYADQSVWCAENLALSIDMLLSTGMLILNGHRLTCSPALPEPIARELALSPHGMRFIDAIRKVFRVADHRYGNTIKTFSEGMRDLRLCLYAGQYADFQRLMQALQGYFGSEWKTRHPYITLFDAPFNAEWQNHLPPDLAAQAVATVLAVRSSRLEPASDALEWLIIRGTKVPQEQLSWYATVIAEQLVLQGRLTEAEEWAVRQNGALKGLACLVRGETRQALIHFDAGMQEGKKGVAARKIGPNGLTGIALVISLIGSGQNARLEQAAQHIAALMRHPSPWLAVYAALGYAARAAMAISDQVDAPSSDIDQADKDPLSTLFLAECASWLSPERLEQYTEKLQRLHERAHSGGYRWVAAEAADLLGRAGDPIFAELARSLHDDLGTRPLAEAVRRQSNWERGLGALSKLAAELAVPAVKPKNTRLVWMVLYDSVSRTCTLEPREQKRDVGSHWTKGRPLSLKRVINGTDLDYLTEQDRAALAFIRTQRGRHSGPPTLDVPGALTVLVGHPLLFWGTSQNNRPLQLVRGEPELAVRLEGTEIFLELSPFPSGTANSLVLREAPDRLRLIELKNEHQRLARILGEKGLMFPRSEQLQIEHILKNLQSKIPVISELAKDEQELWPQGVESRLYAPLTPHANGLVIEFACYPLGEDGMLFTPGQGPAGLPKNANPNSGWMIRNLRQEHERAAYWLNLCAPFLDQSEQAFGGISRNAMAACELLDILGQADPEVLIRWPAGERIQISGEGDIGQFSARLKAGENWLTLDGNIQIDEDQVISLQALLEVTQKKQRFVSLGEGRFIRLHQSLQEKASALLAMGEWTPSGLQVHPMAAPQLNEILNELGSVKADRQWAQLLARQSAAEIAVYPIPNGLNAELRDYQRAGFSWLARLAELGAGACLADDMGLGKTIQVLTLLLHRFEKGPALVVAPTSVAGNWVAEAKRFAPSLQIHWIGPGQREQDTPHWQGGDLVITSYTLFQQDVLNITQQHWATVILDEAQAIKNTGTKRSQTAMRIQSDFRVITTGTPIENNLSELWNLFRFINPGLLGSLESFQTRFATPVERDGEAEARDQLKRLIAPFVLRRTKSEVLKELPDRTEVSRRLELSADERALYEAVRREVLNEVEEGGGEGEPNRMRVLAGIMRLRRTCCHPRLVAPNSEITATKTTAFMELVRELLEGGHRALIFSQFVDHLSVLREQLDQKGIRYTYLDGGTPLIERVRRVEAFQAGDTDLFLISLRAGGTGLNLTSADYVIHMDPWWNPAVEDQASDRAHRMGQTRPVTVYRLLMANSIEEKIMALHERKRHLADSLLDGVGEAASLTVNELMGLLREA